MGDPWYTFPRIDNFGMIDPAGNFWKPDSNIQVPGYYPITALHSGVVTSLRYTDFGQAVITVKLDNAFNDLATHEFYEHLSSWEPSLSVGSHVNQGQLIGHNNPGGQVPLGFGFYSGDTYGGDSAWDVLQKDLCPGCPNKLNPVKVLDAARGGSIPQGTGGGGNYAATANPLDPSTWFPSIAPTLRVWGEYAAIFLLAIIFIGVGIYLMGGHPIQTAQDVTSAPVDFLKNRQSAVKEGA